MTITTTMIARKLARKLSRTKATRVVPRAFTLAELLVAMAVIAVVATITVIAVKEISNDARLSSGRNAVTAALATARARALGDNRITAIVFRPRLDGREQYVEIVTAQWQGESGGCYIDGNSNNGRLVDRFVPVSDVQARRLPKGIKVAGPNYDEGLDSVWLVQAHLPVINQQSGLGELPGRMIAVIYGPDGTTISRNSVSDAERLFVDFNGDGSQNIGGQDVNYNFFPSVSSGEFNAAFFDQVFTADEPFCSAVPFLSVYDDTEARDRRATDWTAATDQYDELTGPEGYITAEADRIHFNRYTGVVLR